MVSGEIPVELGASWFSPKCVEAQRFMRLSRGKALFRCGLVIRYQIKANSEYYVNNLPVRLRGISFVVKRETAQITS